MPIPDRPKGYLERAEDNVVKNRGKVTPDHIIILDYLIYTQGNLRHELAWEDIKRELKREAGILWRCWVL